MANYVGFCRTNYFRVKDYKAFEDWVCDIPGVELRHRPPSGTCDDTQFCLIFEEGLPSFSYDIHEPGDEVEINWVMSFTEHLAKDETVVIMEIGYEGMRWLNGVAWAIHFNGEEEYISIGDIYDQCLEKFGKRPTKAEY